MKLLLGKPAREVHAPDESEIENCRRQLIPENGGRRHRRPTWQSGVCALTVRGSDPFTLAHTYQRATHSWSPSLLVRVGVSPTRAAVVR